MQANAPLRPARASTARQHRERPRPTPPLSRLGGRSLPFDRVWPSPISSSATLQTYAVRRHTAQSWYQSALSLRRIPRLRGQRCEIPFSRSGYVQHGVTNHPTAGLSIPDNPPRVSARRRRSLPATLGRERLAPLSGQPQPVAGRLRLLISCHFGRRQPQHPPRETVREARPPRRLHRSSTYSTTSTAAVRPNRASGARGGGSRLSTVPVGSPSGSRPYEALDSSSLSSPSSCASSSTETSIRSVDSPARNVGVPLVAVHIVPGP